MKIKTNCLHILVEKKNITRKDALNYLKKETYLPKPQLAHETISFSLFFPNPHSYVFGDLTIHIYAASLNNSCSFQANNSPTVTLVEGWDDWRGLRYMNRQHR